MRIRILHYLLAAGVLASPAYARSIAMPGASCTNGMQETVNMNISFNIHTQSFTDAKKKFDENMDKIKDFAKQQNIGKFELQSMNYSINAQAMYDEGMPQPGYQLTGNASYMMDSSDNAFKLGEFLTQQKFHIGVNVNKNKNPNCMNATEDDVATPSAPAVAAAPPAAAAPAAAPPAASPPVASAPAPTAPAASAPAPKSTDKPATAEK